MVEEDRDADVVSAVRADGSLLSQPRSSSRFGENSGTYMSIGCSRCYVGEAVQEATLLIIDRCHSHMESFPQVDYISTGGVIHGALCGTF
jgi:hypothetical protein